jgi:quinoprotein glucose dehydrogenase
VGVAAQEPILPVVADASPEAEAAVQSIVIPEGFEASLFAAEPMLANPVCFDVDDSGAFYVGETFRHSQGATDLRDHMDWLEDELQTRTVADRLAMFKKWEGDGYAEYGRATDRVRRIVDTDGDGRADQATVFATGFDDPAAGIGAGLLARGSEVYYTCIPDFFKLTDADGDGVAEGREILTTGYGVNIAMIGHDLHGLLLGWDGRIYFSCGDRGFTVLTENGLIEHVDAGAVLRCEPDGSVLEVWHTGLRNPQELAFDDFGNLFTGDNNSDSGDRARWVHVVEGGDSGWRYSYQWIEGTWRRGPWNDEKLWHPHHEGQAAYIVPPIVNHAAGPSGLVHYPGTGFPPEYQGAFFLVDFTGSPKHSSVHSFHVLPRGASFEMGEVERFLSGVLATDVDFGPDGGLYISDWVEGWATTGKGRLFRIAHETAGIEPIVRETETLLTQGMVHRHTDELGVLLGHADRRVRLNAQLELAGRGSEGYAVLADAALRGTTRFARIHGVWGLGVLRRLSPPERSRILDETGTVVDPIDPLVKLLADHDAEIRAQAVRVLGDAQPEWIRGVAHQVVARTADSSPRVRFFAAIAAGRLRLAKATPRLVDILRSTEDTDTDLRHATIQGLAGCATTDELVALADDPSRFVRIGAAVALRRREDPAVARFLADEDPGVVVEAARAIHDLDALDTAEGLEALAGVADRLEETPGLRVPSIVRRVLSANDRLGTLAHARRVFRFASLADTDERLRIEAIRILAEWPDARNLDRVHGRWAPRGEREAHFRVELAHRLFFDQLRTRLHETSEGVLLALLDLVESTLAHTSPGDQAYASHFFDADAFDETTEAYKTVDGLSGLPFVFSRVFAAEGVSSTVRVAAFDASMEVGGLLAKLKLEHALDDADGAVRAAGLRWLERADPEKARRLVVDILDHGELAERRVALRILGADASQEATSLLSVELEKLLDGRQPGELALDLLEACADRSSEGTEILLERHRAREAGDEELQPWTGALLGGDAERGGRLFRDRVDLACQRCHAVTDEEEGHGIGPNLKGVSERLGRLQLLESIVLPNRRTTRGYDATAFVVQDELVVGRVIEETDDEVTVLDADGEQTKLLTSEIESRRKDLSAMPNGIGALLTPREMRDLIEYLASL